MSNVCYLDLNKGDATLMSLLLVVVRDNGRALPFAWEQQGGTYIPLLGQVWRKS